MTEHGAKVAAANVQPMAQLITQLPIEDCIRVLQEQVPPLTLLSRGNIFRPKTSKVLGKVQGHSFYLESSADPFSKRFIGTLRDHSGSTLIDYKWKSGLGHRLYGDGAFDEEEILAFLHDWLRAEPVRPNHSR